MQIIGSKKRMFLTVTIFIWCCLPAFGAGPVYPDGWRCPGGIDPSNPLVARPYDLNRSGTGGIFVLENPKERSFALFALTYSHSSKDRWQVLEKHPVTKLAQFSFVIEASNAEDFPEVRGCLKNLCNRYQAKVKGGRLVRLSP